jgi:hypothetical protein
MPDAPDPPPRTVQLSGTAAGVSGASGTLTVSIVKEVTAWIVDHRILFALGVFLVVVSPVISWALSLLPWMPGGVNIVIGIALNIVASVLGALGITRGKRKVTVTR